MLEFIEDNWHGIFVATGAVSILNGKHTTINGKVAQMAALIVFIAATFKFEKFLISRVIKPLLSYLFGDHEERMRRVEEEERKMKEALKRIQPAVDIGRVTAPAT